MIHAHAISNIFSQHVNVLCNHNPHHTYISVCAIIEKKTRDEIAFAKVE